MAQIQRIKIPGIDTSICDHGHDLLQGNLERFVQYHERWTFDCWVVLQNVFVERMDPKPKTVFDVMMKASRNAPKEAPSYLQGRYKKKKRDHRLEEILAFHAEWNQYYSNKGCSVSTGNQQYDEVLEKYNELWFNVDKAQMAEKTKESIRRYCPDTAEKEMQKEGLYSKGSAEELRILARNWEKENRDVLSRAQELYSEVKENMVKEHKKAQRKAARERKKAKAGL